MRKLAMAAAVCGALILPSQAIAQDSRPAAGVIDEIKAMDSRHLAAIAVGAVGGAVVLHWVVGGSAASWIGAGAGALIGDWYYVEKVRGVSVAGVTRAGEVARSAVAELDAGLIEAKNAVYRQIDGIR